MFGFFGWSGNVSRNVSSSRKKGTQTLGSCDAALVVGPQTPGFSPSSRRRVLGQTVALLVSLALPAVGCSKSSNSSDKAKVEPAKAAPKTLRFSGIPDADKAALRDQYQKVADFLGQKLGRKVEYVHVPDYTAAVTALSAGQIDFAWLGGVTAVQAKQQSGDQVYFVASRARDLKFRSYFIANSKFAKSHKLAALDTPEKRKESRLEVLVPVLGKAKMTFGAKASTSGHIMPRYYLSQPPLSALPERSFAGPVAYQLQGGHHATMRAVASGAADLGAINYATWEAASPELQASTPVVAVTPEYVDYAIVGHKKLGEETLSALREALTSLDPSSPEQAAVLQAFSAQSFVPVKAEQWAQIESVLARLTQAQKLG